jgi:hypothetical protein
MHSYGAQLMPLASSPFSFGMSNMTLHMPSSILTSNVNASFGSRGTSPPYNDFLFGGGHIPQSFPMIEGWNLPSSTPNHSYNFQGWNGPMSSVSTSYISFVYPLSTMHVPTNDFIIENPPPTSGVTSGGNPTTKVGHATHKKFLFNNSDTIM